MIDFGRFAENVDLFLRKIDELAIQSESALTGKGRYLLESWSQCSML